MKCKAIQCQREATYDHDFCFNCQVYGPYSPPNAAPPESPAPSLSAQYPQYYKALGDMTEIDVYAVHHLFDIQDPSGALQHASKKLLLSGVRTGGKSAHKDIREAKDTLARWLQLNPENT